MSNGAGPPELSNSDYQTIKSGTCITSGTYLGCIKVGATYYWISNGTTVWELHDGTPNATQVKIGTTVWNKCKDGGDLTWDSDKLAWTEPGHAYRWNGTAGGDVYLQEV